MRNAVWSSRRSFTLVELLIVIAIIILLVGLLLPALAGVSKAGREVKSEAILREFILACDRFYQDHGQYPGIVPEDILALHNHEVAHGNGGPAISGTENALMHLLGGYVIKSEVDQATYDAFSTGDGWYEYRVLTPGPEPFLFKFNQSRLGEGPVINGKQYPPYLSGIEGSIRVADARGSGFRQWLFVGGDEEFDDRLRLPEVVDAWGTPILYLRQARALGALAGDAHIYMIEKPRFYVDNIWPYVRAEGQMWGDPCTGGFGEGSLLSTGHPHGSGGFGPHEYPLALALLLQHATFEKSELLEGTPRGSIVAMSAGADRIYFSAADGPGTEQSPIGNTGCSGRTAMTYEQFLRMGPTVVDLFDDILVFSGAAD